MIALRHRAVRPAGRMAAAFVALTATIGTTAGCGSRVGRTTSVAAASSVVPKASDTPRMASSSVLPASAAPQAPTAAATDLPQCRAHDVQLRLDSLSPETGEHVFGVRIKNTGKPCAFIGYPTVQLLDENGSPLPVSFHNGGRYTTTAAPREVVLLTGAAAAFVVAKYRCDLGPGEPATSAHIVLPGATTATVLPVIGDLEYCGASGEGDADDVYVSPIEPDFAAATRH